MMVASTRIAVRELLPGQNHFQMPGPEVTNAADI